MVRIECVTLEATLHFRSRVLEVQDARAVMLLKVDGVSLFSSPSKGKLFKPFMDRRGSCSSVANFCSGFWWFLLSNPRPPRSSDSQYRLPGLTDQSF